MSVAVARDRNALNAVLAGMLAAIAALALAHGRSTLYNSYVLLAYSLMHDHRIYIDAVWPDRSIDAIVFHGHRYIVNDPIPALLVMPLVLLDGTAANQTLLACLLCGVATGAAWALLARIGVTTRDTVWLVVFFVAGTDLLWCSMLGDVWFIAQTSAVAFMLLALCELAGKRRGWLVALWFALALGSRFTLVMALPVLLWWSYDGFLVRARKPRFRPLRIDAMSSTQPMAIMPVTSIASAPVVRVGRSASAISGAPANSRPPMVGVPVFAWCVCGASS